MAEDNRLFADGLLLINEIRRIVAEATVEYSYRVYRACEMGGVSTFGNGTEGWSILWLAIVKSADSLMLETFFMQIHSDGRGKH